MKIFKNLALLIFPHTSLAPHLTLVCLGKIYYSHQGQWQEQKFCTINTMAADFFQCSITPLKNIQTYIL